MRKNIRRMITVMIVALVIVTTLYGAMSLTEETLNISLWMSDAKYTFSGLGSFTIIIASIWMGIEYHCHYRC